MGAAGEAVKRGLGFGDSPSKGQGQGQGGSDGSAPPQPFGKSVMLTEANVKRLADGLSRMRGAALKLGQMLSLADDDMLPVDVRACNSTTWVTMRWVLQRTQYCSLRTESPPIDRFAGYYPDSPLLTDETHTILTAAFSPDHCLSVDILSNLWVVLRTVGSYHGTCAVQCGRDASLAA